MLFSSAAPQPVHSELGLNVGDILERVIALKQAAKQKKFQSFNPSTDNFPFLLKESGVHDCGNYRFRWTSKTDFEKRGGYSAISMYQLRGVKGSKPLTTIEVLEQLNVRHNMQATTRELLGLFVNHRAEMEAFLKRKHRLVALGSDIFHTYGATVLGLKRRVLSLRDVTRTGEALWLPSDIFITRVEDLS